MTRFLLALLLGVSAALGLLRLLPLRAASVVAQTLAQTPVTGRLADGGTFHGRLTLQALRLDEAGQLVATGVLAGTATPAAGHPTKVPAHPFTTPVGLLDLRGTCRTLVVDLAPLTVTPLAQELTLVPVVLAPEAAPPGVTRASRPGGGASRERGLGRAGGPYRRGRERAPQGCGRQGPGRLPGLM